MTNQTCECADPGCPVHLRASNCTARARVTLYRIDMQDITGTRMCARCAEDAMDSGVFREIGG